MAALAAARGTAAVVGAGPMCAACHWATRPLWHGVSWAAPASPQARGEHGTRGCHSVRAGVVGTIRGQL